MMLESMEVRMGGGCVVAGRDEGLAIQHGPSASQFAVPKLFGKDSAPKCIEAEEDACLPCEVEWKPILEHADTHTTDQTSFLLS